MAEELSNTNDIPARILSEVSRVVVGKDDLKEMLLVALLSGGHALIEGLSGTGKTTLARTFAQIIGGEFKRIQFTADMLPADVTGFYAYTLGGEATFNPGPVFANIILADELNRTTPRTQAALLEAMQERQVTIERETHPLPRPFMVVASQLAYGAEGTYPLTEVQADRFMFRLWSGYPDKQEEGGIIDRIDYLDAPDVKSVTNPEAISMLQQAVREVYVSPEVVDYIVTLVGQVRRDPDVLVGPSPRASIALYKGSRALALLEGRDFVLPDDVKRLAAPSMAHRIRLKAEAEVEDITPMLIIERALEGVPVPKVER